MKSPFKIVTTLTCEHIIEGSNKKHTLINTYAGNVLLNEFPAQLFLAFYIEFVCNKAQVVDAEIALFVGRKEAMRGAVQVAFDGVNPVILSIPAGVLKLEKPTTLKLVITPKGGKAMKIVEKRLMLLESQNFPTS